MTQPVQYMTRSGLWACSCQSENDKPHRDLIEAPADAQGHHGLEGQRWTGSAWVDDPTAAAAFAMMYPEQALAQERATMVADKWQVVAALEILHPGAWAGIMAFRTAKDEWGNPLCDPVTGAAIDYAVTLPRLSETIDMLAYLLGLEAAQVDDLYRLAMTIRG